MKVPTILLATMSLDLGGAETHVVGLAKELKKRSRRVLVASHGGRLVQELTSSGVPHVCLSLHTRSPISLLTLPRKLEKLVADQDVDIIHAHARIPAWVSHVVSARTGVPYVTTYHYPFVAGFPWKYVTRPGLRTIVVSEDIGEYVVKEFGFTRDRVRVIYNGIDTDRFSPRTDRRLARQSLGLEGDEGPVIAHLSRQTPELAGVALALVEATGELLRDFPRLKLLIAGDGPFLDQVRERASRLNGAAGSERVKVLGGVTETPLVYAAADVVVGMSRVALEAMASARPVIIAGPGGISGYPCEESWERMSLYNFTSRDARERLSPEGLRRMIAGVLRNPDLARALSSFGRELVTRRFSIAWMTGEVERVYREVLPGYPT